MTLPLLRPLIHPADEHAPFGATTDHRFDREHGIRPGTRTLPMWITEPAQRCVSRLKERIAGSVALRQPAINREVHAHVHRQEDSNQGGAV